MDFYKEIMFVPLSCLNLNRQWNVGGERQRGDPLDRAEICCLLTTEAWDTSLLPRRLWSLPDAAGSDVGNLAAHPTGLWDFFSLFMKRRSHSAALSYSCKWSGKRNLMYPPDIQTHMPLLGDPLQLLNLLFFYSKAQHGICPKTWYFNGILYKKICLLAM